MGTKELAKAENTALDYTDRELIQTLKTTVAAGTTDAEFKMFVEIAKATELNPFKKEIWCIVIPEKTWIDRKTGQQKKKERQVQMMTGINGYMAIANSYPNYDGYEIETERDTNGKPCHVICKAYRKDRSRPCIGEAWVDEDAQFSDYGSGIWDKRPSTMLAKIAKARAHRDLFPQKLNNLYTDDEMPAEYRLTCEPEAPRLPAPEQRKEEVVEAKQAIMHAENVEEAAGQVFTYDLRLVGSKHCIGPDGKPDIELKKKYWNWFVQEFGAWKKNKADTICFTKKRVQGFDDCLIDAPAQELAGEEDQLPDSFAA